MISKPRELELKLLDEKYHFIPHPKRVACVVFTQIPLKVKTNRFGKICRTKKKSARFSPKAAQTLYIHILLLSRKGEDSAPAFGLITKWGGGVRNFIYF